MAQPVILLCVIISVFPFDSFGLHSGYFPDLHEVAYTNVEHTTHINRAKRSSDIDEPDFNVIETQISGLFHDVKFNFKPIGTHRLSPITHMTSSGILESYEPVETNCYWYYEDISGEAHAVVDACDQSISMIAELYLNGSHHVILPKGDSSGSVTHALYELSGDIDFLEDFAYFGESTPVNDQPYARQKRQADGSYTVELMMVLDYTVYDYWFKWTDATMVNADRDAEAMKTMQAYYSFIARAIDFRYKRIPDITIAVELNKIYVLKTMEASSMTVTTGHVSGVKDVIDANQTLYNLIDWLADKVVNEAGFPNVDHYMLFTGQNLELLGDTKAAGYAAFEKICTKDSVSVVEGGFHFISAVLASHELGHSLGGKHDGTDNLCIASDGFVLSPTNSVKSGAQKNNPFQFSSCSTASFKTFIATLDSNQRNCLLIDGSTLVVDADSTAIGQVYSPDAQCERVFGTNSTMWRYNNLDQTNKNFNGICTSMTCIVDNTGQVMIPADGTSCGSGKWCQNGACVSASGAPPGNDACFFGDQPGQLDQNTTCTSLLEELSNCYTDLVNQQCCASCESKKLAETGCEYGDRYDCSAIEHYQCYSDDLVQKCCGSCLGFKTTYSYLPTECKYGDKVSSCTIAHCQNHATECCATCSSATPAPTSNDTTTMRPDMTTTSTALPTVTESSIPDWAVPVAGALGGLVALVLIGLLVYYLWTRRNRGDKYRHGRSKDRSRGRGRNFPRTPERRYDPYGGRDYAQY